MERSRLPRWTLSLRLRGDVLECGLGDGRRLSWRADRSGAVLKAQAPASLAELIGEELALRLLNSEPRPLVLLYDGESPVDGIDWEQLRLGPLLLGQQFELGRLLVGGDAAEPEPAAPAIADELNTLRLHHDGARASPGTSFPALVPLSLVDPSLHVRLAQADALLLDGITLPELLQHKAAAVPRRCLLLMEGRPAPAEVAAALDAGAAVLCLQAGAAEAGVWAGAAALLQLVSAGQSVGEALRALRRRMAEPMARLYGDPELRFVRPAPPTTRRQVTSLSFDLVGSTALLQALGDEVYAETLTALHRCCADIVRKHGGQPDDPQGDDGVMGYFGHPAALEQAAVRAVEAGLAIVEAVADLGVRVRVGVATGPVAVKAGQPVGLSIHLAARLQQAARAGTVLVSESTGRLVKHAFGLELRTDLPLLKGVEGQAAYRVLGAHDRLNGPPADVPHKPQALVGRQTELARLHQGWQRTQAGEGGLVTVKAEAGMGKSHLVREFRRQLVHAGVRVLELHGRLDASHSPFLALTEALRRWLAIEPVTAEHDARAKLAAALPAHAREGEALALLANLIGLPPQPAAAQTVPSRPRVRGLLVDWLQHFSGNEACCLVVEDWHWIDPSTREFVEHLLQADSAGRRLVLVTTRGPVPAAPGPLSAHDAIELVGLQPAAARELVERVAERRLSPRLVTLLAQRGGGVPLFLEEATRLALELAGGGADTELSALDAVPASVQDLLMARLDALGAAKPVAQVAAVLGRSFSRGLLAALLETTAHDMDAAALDERLEVLEASGLVHRQGDGTLVFRHALIRDAAYASLWERERQALHLRVVDLLKQRWPELAMQHPELLAQHQTEAGLHEEALAQWERAASYAAARSAEIEAVTHLRRALALLQRTAAGEQRDRRALRLRLLLAARLLATEGYGAEAVLEAYLEAQRLCDGIDDDAARFKVEMGLEAYRFMRAEFAPALEHGRRAATMAARSGDLKQRLQAHWGLACTLFHQGELRAAMKEMETALALYSPALHTQFGIQDPGVMCMAYSSWGLWELGRPDAALARINQAVQMAGEFEHRFSQAVALAYAVSIELLRGDFDAALRRAEDCTRICEVFGFPVWLAITRCMRGHMLCARGAFDEGLREMSEGLAQWLRTGARVSQPLYLSLQAEGLLLAGRLKEAAASVDEGLAIVERYGERQLEAELCRLRGEIAMQCGDTEAGLGWLKRAYARALRQHKLGFALRSATALARQWAQAGQPEPARRLLVPLLARWSEGRETRDLRTAAALVGSLP